MKTSYRLNFMRKGEKHQWAQFTEQVYVGCVVYGKCYSEKLCKVVVVSLSI